MFSRPQSRLSNANKGDGFNITPIIDIVFLLMIFFVLAAQFIEAENFPVDVPDDCEFAESKSQHRIQTTTVTVMKNSADSSEFAVGAEKINAKDSIETVKKIAESIDNRLKDMQEKDRSVTLRADKDAVFGQVQYALAGIAESCAVNIKLSVLKEKH